MCASAFLGIISPQKIVWAGVPAYASPGTAAEGGANTYLGRAVGTRENASLGTVPEGRYVSWPAMNWSMQVKKCTAEPATTAEGDVHAGKSTLVTDCPYLFPFVCVSHFGPTFPHPLHMASTSYISISAMFSLLLSCSITFQFLLLSSKTFTRTILEHSSYFRLSCIYTALAFIGQVLSSFFSWIQAFDRPYLRTRAASRTPLNNPLWHSRLDCYCLLLLYFEVTW